MSWRLNLNARATGRPPLTWVGPLTDPVRAKDYGDGWVDEWIAFPKLSPEALDVSMARIRADLEAWRDAEDAVLRPDGRGRNLETIPARICPCCARSIRFGDARYWDMENIGVCSDCHMYLLGRADSVRVGRDPTVEEALLLPPEYLSGDARTFLRLLRSLGAVSLSGRGVEVP